MFQSGDADEVDQAEEACTWIVIPIFGYMRATKFPIGILVNFGTDRRAQIERYHYADGKLFVF